MKRVGIRSSDSGAAPRLPNLDGFAAKLGGTTPGVGTKNGVCSLCGAKGHTAASHVGGKAVVDAKPSGEAIEQDKATQFLINKSPLTTGNPNYKSPGSAGGMT